MRKEFNTLVELMNRYDLYQLGDEVGIALSELEQKITEIEKRIDCAIRSNKDNEIIVIKLAHSFQDDGNLEEILNYGDFETLQRSVYDVDISLNFNDTEPIDNIWYGLFEVKEEVSSGGIPYKHCAECNIKEEPPTSLCKTPQTHEFVKDIIAKLKVIDIDGETMQYILEQVGMGEQMLRQLAMSSDYNIVSSLLTEKRYLAEYK